MNHNMDTIQNAELKEAFDEFDKVGYVASII